MTNKRIKWADGEIIVRPTIVQDDIDAQVKIEAPLTAYAWSIDPQASGQWKLFASLCGATIQSAGLSFKPELIMDAPLTVQNAAYNQFTQMPQGIRDNWKRAYDLVNVVKGVIIEDVEEEDLKK